jgi:hypothetical protein
MQPALLEERAGVGKTGPKKIRKEIGRLIKKQRLEPGI